MAWFSEVWWWVLFGFGATALHIAYFLRLPGLAEAMARRGNRTGARRLLTRVVNTPSLLGNLLKVNALYQLAGLELTEGMYAAALPHLRKLAQIVGSDRTAPGLEYDIRSKIAQCLRQTGSDTEAEAEQERAEKALENAPLTPPTLIARGQMLEKQFRFSEACTAFEQALNLPYKWTPDARAEVMAGLGNASYNAGQVDQTIVWGEAALGQAPERPMLREIAHVIAGLGHGAQGNLDAAERHRAAALALASAANADERAGQYRLQLADIARKRGRITQAFAVTQEFMTGEKSTPQLKRDAGGVAVECLRSWGRPQEALDQLSTMRHDTIYAPELEVRFRGVTALFSASLLAEAGEAGRAREELLQAEEALGRDERLSLACRGLSAWVSALEGNGAQSRALLTQVEAQMPSTTHDREARLGCLNFLAQAAMARGERDRARTLWQSYLDSGPDPVARPTALYYLAECYRREGHANEAQTYYHQAAESGIDTHHTRLAAEHLPEALAVSPQNAPA